ncbi:MAG: hypothetical protein WBA97_35135 [Actinophytocola sp.]|uniref:hypothetical protein n=1 Tax=Actinophytocola sp. TaxID=1872138 RepID=UPI003C7571EA
MPDGANTDNTENTEPEQDPGTAAEQVNQEIASTEVLTWWRSLFGFGGPPQPHESGGGGAGGQFMFANLEELDAVIAKWEEERDGILADRQAIHEALDGIAEPAGDTMSQFQANASRDSLSNMFQHNNAMLRYAENYIEKLYESREQIAVMEDGARDQMRSVRGSEA